MAEVVRPAWLPEGLYEQWLLAYTEAGGAAVPGSENYATELVRASAEYDSYFPGLRREDGALRYTTNPERTYFDNINSFRNTIEGLGMKADIFGEEYIALIEGDTSPAEFAMRASALQERVLGAGAGIRDWYATNYGINMTDQGILAALMSERIDTAILLKQITMAEIGGEASVYDMDITTGFVNALEEAGMTREDAQRFFGSANLLMPMLSQLAARHGDPNDEFDIMELAGAGGYLPDLENIGADITRLQAQEASTFTGGAGVDIVRGRTGAVTGLLDI